MERIVAIGDVHGGYQQFVSLLQSTGLIDAKDKWIGGKTHLVQTGDVVDRGPESRKVMDLLMQLDRQARKTGGYVHALIGNHEAMNIYGDLRYVWPEEYEAFRESNSTRIRDFFYKRYVEEMKESSQPQGLPEFDEAYQRDWESRHPLGYFEHRFQFGPNGEYGKWIRGHNTVIKINGVSPVPTATASKHDRRTRCSLNDRGARTAVIGTSTQARCAGTRPSCSARAICAEIGTIRDSPWWTPNSPTPALNNATMRHQPGSTDTTFTFGVSMIAPWTAG